MEVQRLFSLTSAGRMRRLLAAVSLCCCLFAARGDDGGNAELPSAAAADQHEFVGMNSLLFVVIIGVCMFTARVLQDLKFFYLPSSGASMILGFIIGLISTLFGEEETQYIWFQPNLFFYILLPPIIFDAGYSLERRNFFRNFTTINVFSVLGTLVSTFVIGFSLYGMAKIGLVGLNSTDSLECLTFASLISAVDPVATLSILGSPDINTDPLLYSLVFGESVLNDAVSIVLFRTFQQVAPGTQIDIWRLLLSFIGVSIASITVGTAVALICSLIFRFLSFKNSPAHEYTLVLLFAYATYCLAEIVGLSGVMALFFCGISMRHYMWYNLSEIAQKSTQYVFHSFALLSETFLFAYLGITAGVSFQPSIELAWSPFLVIFTLILCFLSRAMNIFPLSWLVNLRRKKKITFKMQVVMWFAGLRGAVSFALALSADSKNRGLIVTTTLTVVFFTTLVCGGLTEPLLSKMHLRRNLDDPRNPLVGYAVDEDDVHEQERGPNAVGGFHKLWRDIDNKYMRSWFGGQRTLYRSRQTERPRLLSLSEVASPPSMSPQRRSVASVNVYATGEDE